MKVSRIAVVLILVTFVSACQANKQTGGTLIGAGAGALLGSQLGSGRGKLAMVALGALGGAWLGSEIGKSMDEADRQRALRAQNRALETGRSGTSVAWRNPDNGHSGQITPRPSYQRASGETCREYEHEVTIDGRREIMKGTACRQRDGTWRTIN
jgi:surface antigen